MAKVDPRDFLLNTDYEMDKLVLLKQGEFTSSIEIPHNLSFTPLPFGVWSTDEDFDSVNTIGAVDPNDEPWYTPALGVECYADATKIKLTSSGNTNNTKIYYRIYAFEPDDSKNNAPFTSQKAKKFILNTDYNYCKVKAHGVFTASGQSYEHNLGYLPQVMAWYVTTADQKVYPLMSSSEFTNVKLKVTDTQIIAGDFWAGYFNKIYWKVYYDEA